MGKLTVFNFVTLNGFFEGPNGDLSWHTLQPEEHEFAIKNANSGSTLLFGRITYEHMIAWWPTPTAMQNDPGLSGGMNKAEKIVFSRTLKKADWNNTRLVRDNMIEEVIKLKKAGKDMAILGSASISAQLAEQGLIDTYQFMVDPVLLGSGRPLYQGIKHRISLKLAGVHTFSSGTVLLTYER